MVRPGTPPAAAPADLAKHEAAFGLAGRHGFPLHHALIVAAALEAGCATLFPEDMQDGQATEGRLTICNPFAAAACGNPNLPQVAGSMLRHGRTGWARHRASAGSATYQPYVDGWCCKTKATGRRSGRAYVIG